LVAVAFLQPPSHVGQIARDGLAAIRVWGKRNRQPHFPLVDALQRLLALSPDDAFQEFRDLLGVKLLENLPLAPPVGMGKLVDQVLEPAAGVACVVVARLIPRRLRAFFTLRWMASRLLTVMTAASSSVASSSPTCS